MYLLTNKEKTRLTILAGNKANNEQGLTIFDFRS